MNKFTKVLLLLIVLLGLLFFLSNQQQKNFVSKITTFKDCKEAGFPILESFPERCLTPDGRTLENEEVVSNSNAQLLSQNGNFVLATSSEVLWEGRKTLISNYVDRGSIDISKSVFVVEGGLIKSGEIVFDMQSISVLETGKGSGNDGLVKHLKSADFFEVDKYNTARLEIVDSKYLDDGSLAVNAKLTIKDVTKDIEFVAKLSSDDSLETFGVTGEVSVNRADFGVKYGSDTFFDNLGDNIIDDNFKIIFSLEAYKQEV